MPPEANLSASIAATMSGPESLLWRRAGRRSSRQGFPLLFRRGEIVMIVQADFAHGPDRAPAGQILELPEMGIIEFSGLVGVDARGGHDLREGVFQGKDGFHAPGLDEVGGTEDGDDPGLLCPADGLLPVRVEIGHVQMGVGIDQTRARRRAAQAARSGGRSARNIVLSHFNRQDAAPPSSNRPAAGRGSGLLVKTRSPDSFGVRRPGHWAIFALIVRRGIAP
jgi:hypothetical protein